MLSVQKGKRGLVAAVVEPLQRLADNFGSTSIQQDQSEPPSVLSFENQRAYPSPGSIGWGQNAGAAKASGARSLESGVPTSQKNVGRGVGWRTFRHSFGRCYRTIVKT